MTLEIRSAGDRDDHVDPIVPLRSFHGNLLINSRRNLLDEHRIRRMAMLSGRWGWLGRLVGQLAIFLGGLSIGSGAILLKKIEWPAGVSGILVGCGAGCVIVSITAQVLSREMSRRWSSPGRG